MLRGPPAAAGQTLATTARPTEMGAFGKYMRSHPTTLVHHSQQIKCDKLGPVKKLSTKNNAAAPPCRVDIPRCSDVSVAPRRISGGKLRHFSISNPCTRVTGPEPQAPEVRTEKTAAYWRCRRHGFPPSTSSASASSSPSPSPFETAIVATAAVSN